MREILADTLTWSSGMRTAAQTRRFCPALRRKLQISRLHPGRQLSGIRRNRHNRVLLTSSPIRRMASRAVVQR